MHIDADPHELHRLDDDGGPPHEVALAAGAERMMDSMTSEELDWKNELHDLAAAVLEYNSTLLAERGRGWHAVRLARLAMLEKAKSALVKTAPGTHTGSDRN